MEYSATSIYDVFLEELGAVNDERGLLTVLEIQKTFQIRLSRVFFIETEGPSVRGGHAHRLCKQIFICNSGTVKISCYDSRKIVEYELQDNKVALFVPNGIWVNLDFPGPALITVLCDQPYIESEYVRDIETFNIGKNV
jgi:dTDP-4-dehydrorhamnose 3,5-epimerase-like enzyme